jgi:hypothetical protein
MAVQSNSRGCFYLELSQLPITFGPIGTTNRGSFFDPYNKQMLCVQNNNTDVNVKGLLSRDNFLLNIPSKGPVRSIKFSGGNPKVLSIQRRSNTVEFVTVFSSNVTELSLPRKPHKNEAGEILDFFWVFQNEIVVVVRKGGIDTYYFDIKKLDFRLAKSISLNVGWSLFCHENEVLLVRLKDDNQFFLFGFKRGSSPPIYRKAKFDIDIPVPSNAARALLMPIDVVIVNLYGTVYIAVRLSIPGRETEIVLYHVSPDGSTRPAHRLAVDVKPPFTMSVVDNLVVVHHQVSRTSMVFDIALEDQYTLTSSIALHRPILSPLPIAPCLVTPKKASGGRSPATPTQGKEQPAETREAVELYSVSWVLFQPDIIIDVQLGLMWQLKLNLEGVKSMMSDKIKLVRFLFNRSDGKNYILSICREGLDSTTKMPFEVMSPIFDIISMEFKLSEHSKHLGDVHTMDSGRPKKLFTISPTDLYTKVFIPHKEGKACSLKALSTALCEYVRTLHKREVKVDSCIYELMISILMEQKNFYQLQQFIQYHVIEDSQPLACLLLSKELAYPASSQLALDMYRRQPNTEDDIIEIMFSKGEILTALRLVRSLGRENAVSARRFLEAAANESDKMIFYSVYKYFEERNLRLRNTADFPPGEQCQPFTELFKEWFSDD